MKMRVLALVLCCASVFAQEKTLNWNSEALIGYFTRNLQNIERVAGKTWVCIPLEQKLKKNARTIMIEGYLVQYKDKDVIEGFVLGENDKVEILKLKTKARYFNFETKKITDVNMNVDDDVFRRPKDLKKKVENKIKKKAIKKQVKMR